MSDRSLPAKPFEGEPFGAISGHSLAHPDATIRAMIRRAVAPLAAPGPPSCSSHVDAELLGARRYRELEGEETWNFRRCLRVVHSADNVGNGGVRA